MKTEFSWLAWLPCMTSGLHRFCCMSHTFPERVPLACICFHPLCRSRQAGGRTNADFSKGGFVKGGESSPDDASDDGVKPAAGV